MQKIRTLRVLSLAALAGALVAPLAASAGIPKTGGPAPAFSLPRVDGKTQTLAALRGKPVYLNFFASWCAPCNEEAPSIESLYKKYHSRGLVTVGIDELEGKTQALGFAKKFGSAYTLVLDNDGAMSKDYGIIGLPVHVFIDRRGNVSTFRQGEMSPAEIEAAIKKIL